MKPFALLLVAVLLIPATLCEARLFSRLRDRSVTVTKKVETKVTPKATPKVETKVIKKVEVKRTRVVDTEAPAICPSCK